jgi:hypothetical protein
MAASTEKEPVESSIGQPKLVSGKWGIGQRKLSEHWLKLPLGK